MNLSQTVIETERLKLIPISEEYAFEIFKEFDEEITTYMMSSSPRKIEETLEYIQKSRMRMSSGEEFSVSIFDKKTGEFLGGGGAVKLNTGKPWLGIWIKKSAHGNKYGREAVMALKDWVDKNINYEYIAYPVDKKNIASRKIAESLGGVIEEEYQKKNTAGKILDLVEYRIYKS